MPIASFSVGTSGNSLVRVGDITARQRALPASIIARASGTEQVVMSRPLAARSCIAGAAPFDGTHATWLAGRPIACIQPTSARCQMPPWPVPDALNLPGGAALMASARSLTVLYGLEAETWMPGGSSFI